jgi:hypothetical protein
MSSLVHSSEDVVNAVTRLLSAEGNVAVMAGHFALVQRLTADRLSIEVVPNIGHADNNMSIFPIETWRVGIEIARCLRAAGRTASLLVLVNDWQHLPAARDGQRNTFRDAFFAKAELPAILKRMLEESGLGKEALITYSRDGKPRPLWAESKLRGFYHRHLKGKGRLSPIDSPCAQEWVPLLVHLSELGYSNLIAFVPNACTAPVLKATEIADTELELDLRTVNIFPSGEEEQFWSNTRIEN